MSAQRCPKCDKDMDTVDSEPDVNVIGGFVCDECEYFIPEWDVDSEP